jgi:hypothetical protein
MARFYGGVEGNRGPATRQGSKESGITAYAQSYDSRITVEYREARISDETVANVTLGGGWMTYYNDRRLTFCPDIVAKALASGDERIEAIWSRIQNEFHKLDLESKRVVQRQNGWKIKAHIRRLPDGREITVKPHYRKAA